MFLVGGQACTTRECDQTFATYTDQGNLVGPDDWESSATDGNWVQYPPEGYLFFQIHPFAGRTLYHAELDISPVENPNLPVSGGDNNWTVASGNLVEFEQPITFTPTFPDGGPTGAPPYFQITVHNDTCATYWARLTLQMEPLAADLDAGDAGDAGDVALDAGDAALD